MEQLSLLPSKWQLASPLLIGLRSSPLSRAQWVEFVQEVSSAMPELALSPLFLSSPGDRDKSSSLRPLEKSDFFTRDLDDAVEEGRCRLALHSAKDLPEPLRNTLQLIALTKGLDSSDSLLLRQGDSWQQLPPSPRIGTSSQRRERAVLQLIPHAHLCDIRGTIEERIALLDGGSIDGLVIAEAALLRLAIDRPRERLPGEGAPLQGQLALVSRRDDLEMEQLFAFLDSRPFRRLAPSVG